MLYTYVRMRGWGTVPFDQKRLRVSWVPTRFRVSPSNTGILQGLDVRNVPFQDRTVPPSAVATSFSAPKQDAPVVNREISCCASDTTYSFTASHDESEARRRLSAESLALGQDDPHLM
jgi:hypothetical protein